MLVTEDFEKRLLKLKMARNNLLAFHKILIDYERQSMERASGAVTAGQFLNLLLNDERFEWLRTISRLVAKSIRGSDQIGCCVIVFNNVHCRASEM